MTKGLAIPSKNEFIPTDFAILPLSRLPQPSIILDEDGELFVLYSHFNFQFFVFHFYFHFHPQFYSAPCLQCFAVDFINFRF